MKILCHHGYFLFEEESPGEIGRFSSIYDVTLSGLPGTSSYTFESLLDAEEYSLAGKDYLNLAATETFEGSPGEILEANGFVYDLNLELLVPLLSIVSMVTLQTSDFYYVSNSLIQPGSMLANGERVLDYKASLDLKTSIFRYTEVGFG